MWNPCKVEKTERAKQAGTGAGLWKQWRCHPENLGQLGEHSATKSNLLRHLLNLKVLLTSKALKLYTTLFSTLTTHCFAPMFKQKLSRCMMNYDDWLRRFINMSTNWYWISIVKISCICGKWLCMTSSNNTIWTLILLKKIAYLTGCVLKRVCT